MDQYSIILAASAAVAAVTPGDNWIKDHIQPAITQQLTDPDSAKFDWPYQFTSQSNGWATCGYVNSKNRMGGYAGRTAVIVVYNEGVKPYFNIAEDNSKWDGVTGMCNEWIENGTLKGR